MPLRIFLSILPVAYAALAYAATSYRPEMAYFISACLTVIGMLVPFLLLLQFRIRLFPQFMNGLGGMFLYVISGCCWALAAPGITMEWLRPFSLVLAILATALLVWETYDNRHFHRKSFY